MQHKTCNPSLFKCYMLHALCFVIALCGLFLVFLSAKIAKADIPPPSLKAVEADVSVSAEVGSPVSASESVVTVSPAKSSIETSTAEIIAGSGQKVLITIKLVDANNNPLVGKKVELRSNRGDIDEISPVTSQNPAMLPISESHAADSNRTNITDKDGIALFTVTSTVPGDATFTVIADNVVLLDQKIKVTFSAPPFPSQVEITISNPFTGKEIKIFDTNPKSGQQGIGVASETARNLVNSTTKINIPFISFIVLLLIGVGIPVFLFIIVLLLFRIKRIEQHEHDVLSGLCLTRGCPKRIGEPPPQVEG